MSRPLVLNYVHYNLEMKALDSTVVRELLTLIHLSNMSCKHENNYHNK